MNRPPDVYAELVQRARQAALIKSCIDLLEWDLETYIPPQGVTHRSEQMALLAGMLHEQRTHPRIEALLTALDDAAALGGVARVNVREIRRKHDRARKLPLDLVIEHARVVSLAQQQWALARKDDDFPRFEPWLERVIALKREEAQAVGYENGEAYDALLDEFEPGSRAADIAPLFEQLRAELVPLVAAIAESPKRAQVSILERDFPIDRQRAFGERVAVAAGFDFQWGRLDTAVHPAFSRIGPGDSRITTRFDAHNFRDALFSILHEVGHALYEQGLDAEQFGLPMGEPISLGVHESQARLWENVVGRSRAFWTHFYPSAREVFPEALGDVDLDAFYFAINHVEPSFIRVDADEVTYNLHVMVRFALERAMLRGELRAADVPGAWNEAYTRYLGVTPPNDTKGCLQDTHWAAGLIGYFPTYALGNIYAAQLVDRAKSDLGDLDGALARGEFGLLLGWLRDHVHRHGHRFWPSELITRATGEPPSTRALVASLREKYGALYDL
jgi:carboxypeptidase Taq